MRCPRCRTPVHGQPDAVFHAIRKDGTRGCQPRYFTVEQRLSTAAVRSSDYALNAAWSPTSPLLDELRMPIWWTPKGITLSHNLPACG